MSCLMAWVADHQGAVAVAFGTVTGVVTIAMTVFRTRREIDRADCQRRHR